MKFIIVHYLNIDNRNPEYIHKLIDDYSRKLEESKSEDYIHYVLPVKNQETKIECINPVTVTEEEYYKAEAVIKRASTLANKLLSTKFGL